MSVTPAAPGGLRDEIERLVALDHPDPHRLLGAHAHGAGAVVRAFRPGAEGLAVVPENASPVEALLVSAAGVFEALLPHRSPPFRYRLEVRYPGAEPIDIVDPYAFLPTLGELDLHLIAEGRHERLYDALGARLRVLDGVEGVAFALWAPNARSVSVVGDFNGWDGRLHQLRSLGAAGVWELFVPDVQPGAHYKYELRGADRRLRLKADPLALAAERPPATASVVWRSEHRWSDAAWIERRGRANAYEGPLAVYELHAGSWRRNSLEGNRSLTYLELADELAAYVADLGFTHVELLPVMEHPFEGSWGYQVTGYYAPTARLGTPDEFRAFVDRLHAAGIGVICDWVPAHFPRDEYALGRFDGTALYEHADPRRGEHPDWGTLVFNFGRAEVRNFLVANALFWLREYHADGLRVDAVASMLYRDYSRAPGQWVPNEHGGNEDEDAIAFLRELTTVTHGRVPGTIAAAEESTAWPGVSRPVEAGGLGFSFKWNLGWMHDTLDYFSRDPVHRVHHHHELTFGLLYAFSENFILPLSHDEVVHGKGSLLGRMPGDRWQRFANLRALYGYMWAHPGKKLLFMGGEFAQEQEWSHVRSLDWHLLAEPDHAGVQALVRDLNAAYRGRPELWERDFDASGFAWLQPDDGAANVLAFARFAADGSPLACICNFSPVVREGYRVGLPRGGRWHELLNTDADRYGGSDVGNLGGVEAEERPWGGQPWSASFRLPPLAVLWFVPA